MVRRRRKRKYAHIKGFYRGPYTIHRHGKLIHIPRHYVKPHRARIWHLSSNQKPVNPHPGRKKRR